MRRQWVVIFFLFRNSMVCVVSPPRNRPLPSSKNPVSKWGQVRNLSCENELWKIISISKAEHLTSFWSRGPEELGNGLLGSGDVAQLFITCFVAPTRYYHIIACTFVYFTPLHTLNIFSYCNVLNIQFWTCNRDVNSHILGKREDLETRLK